MDKHERPDRKADEARQSDDQIGNLEHLLLKEPSLRLHRYHKILMSERHAWDLLTIYSLQLAEG